MKILPGTILGIADGPTVRILGCIGDKTPQGQLLYRCVVVEERAGWEVGKIWYWPENELRRG